MYEMDPIGSKYEEYRNKKIKTLLEQKDVYEYNQRNHKIR